MKVKDSNLLWSPHPIADEEVIRYRFGPLTCWLRRADLDFILFTQHDATEEIRCSVDRASPPSGLKPADRFAHDGGLDQVAAQPILPDRSLVVRPENTLKILSGQRTVFFVSIPLFIRLNLLAEDGRSFSAVELPTTVLSNTWFGDTMTGELCYSLKTTAKHRLETVTRRQWRAICPVTVVNKTQNNLELQRMCVQAKHLGCYQGEKFLWTNAIEVTHRAEGDVLQVSFGEAAPEFETVSAQLSQPREPRRKSLLQRGFEGFRSFGLF